MRSFVVAAAILPLLQLAQPAAAAPQLPAVLPAVGELVSNVPIIGSIVAGAVDNVAGQIPSRRDLLSGVNVGGNTTTSGEASETETTATVTSTFTETTITTTTITETSTATDSGTAAGNALHIGRRQEDPAGSSGAGIVVKPASDNTVEVSVLSA